MFRFRIGNGFERFRETPESLWEKWNEHINVTVLKGQKEWRAIFTFIRDTIHDGRLNIQRIREKKTYKKE